jgi:hypothetical protein
MKKTATNSTSQAKSAQEPYSPTEQERRLVEKFLEKRKEEAPPPKIKAEKEASGTIGIRSEHKDSTVAYALLAKAVGTTDAGFIGGMLTQLARATTGKDEEINQEGLNFVLSVLAGVAPRDRVEDMLAAQMLWCNWQQ